VQDDPESRSFLLYGIRSACCCPRLTAGCTQSKPRQKSAALKKGNYFRFPLRVCELDHVYTKKLFLGAKTNQSEKL